MQHVTYTATAELRHNTSRAQPPDSACTPSSGPLHCLPPVPPLPLHNLRQRLHRILCVHVAHDDAQAVAALKLLDALVDVLRPQQMVPAVPARREGGQA
jgi:hypothetical protein